MIKLDVFQKEQILKIIQAHIPQAKVYVFGSRVTGKTKKFSDLDLAIDAKKELTLIESANLKEAFSNSDLPFRVDLVDLTTAEKDFISSIKDEMVRIQ